MNKGVVENSWIIPSNLSYYDLHGAFKKYNKLDWHQTQMTKNIKVGDEIYIYVSEPEKCIRYKCEVTKVNMPEMEIDDSEFCKAHLNNAPFFQIKKVKEIPEGNITIEDLRKHGVAKNIQGAQHLYKETLKFIENII